MFRTNILGVSAVLIAAAALAGCNDAPTADVAATVNGEVIARGDLALEAQGSGTGADDAATQQALLGQVVNRKLLAQAALAEKVDATPAFKVAERKARETALVEALMVKLAGDKVRPSAATIKNFVAEHPAMFGSREALTLDQIQAPAAAVDGAWLRPADTLADVARILTEHRVPFERGSATADTGAMPPQLLKLLAQRPDEPFALPQGDKLIISQVTARRRIPVPPGQVDVLAAAEIRRAAFQQAATKAIADARAKAKVTYGDGFTAPAEAGAAGEQR